MKEPYNRDLETDNFPDESLEEELKYWRSIADERQKRAEAAEAELARLRKELAAEITESSSRLGKIADLVKKVQELERRRP